MPNNYFRGDSQDLPQIQSFTVTGDSASATYTVTMNGKSVTVAGTGSGTAATATAWQQALAASQIGEFTEVAWSVNSSTITATSSPNSNGGLPFTISISVGGSGGTISGITTSQTASGHFHWDDPKNWTQGWIPQGSCTVPVQSNATLTSGGSLTDGTPYYYVITAFNNNGETPKSNEKTVTPSGANQTAVLSWAQINGATGYKVYRSTTSGTYTTPALVATISSGSTLTYNDTGTATTTGAPPGVNGAVGDDVYITKSSVSILYGLTQTGIVLNSLTIDSTYTGSIGLPPVNALSYYEYRPRYLQISAPTVNIGYGTGSCSPQIFLNLLTAASAVAVYGMATGSTPGVQSLTLTGSNASNSLNVTRGSIGLAAEFGTTAQFPTINVGSQSNLATDVNLVCGAGCTLGTINQNGGIVTSYANVTTWSKTNGDSYAYQTAAITTLNSNGGKGTHYWRSTGTIGTATFDGPNVGIDASSDSSARTLTNGTFTAGSWIFDPDTTISFSNPIEFDAISAAATFADYGWGNGTFHLQRS